MDQSPAAAHQQLTFKKKALISAVTTGDTETVVDLLDGGLPIDTKNNEGVSLLHWASSGGHLTTMRLLIRRGCDVDSVDSKGLTPLHWAAANGQTKAVRELIRSNAAKSWDAGEFGTPLHQAAKKGYVETVVAMLEVECSIRVVNSVGATVLHCAAEGGHVEVVRELVIRGCDVNAVKTNGCTPLHLAAAHGRTEAVRELIKLGADKSVDAGVCGTPIHSGALGGNVDTVEALLEEEICGRNLSKRAVTPSKAQASEYNVIGTCDSVGVTPIMSAALFGQVEMFKFLASKGGTISDIDAYSLSTLEHCFVGGQASKLGQFCEACDIKCNGDGLTGALESLITQGLIDPHKVLCLCAISGDSIFLNDQYIDILARDTCAMSAAVKCAKFYFFKGGVPFLDQLRLPDGSSLSPLHVALLSFKCLRMGFAGKGSSIECGAKDHTAFITKLLSHPVLKYTVHENFPNGLSPLDLARQFEFHHIAELIEKAGGHPGMWADVPQDVFLPNRNELFTISSSLTKVCDTSKDGSEAVRRALIKFLGGQTVQTTMHTGDNSQLAKEQVLGQHPDIGNVVTHVLPRIQVRHWRKFGLAIRMEEGTVDELEQQFSNEDDRYLKILSYWLKQDSSVTWKTLFDVLSNYETKNAVDELADKIVSALGRDHWVSVQVLFACSSVKVLWYAVWRRQGMRICHAHVHGCACAAPLPSSSIRSLSSSLALQGPLDTLRRLA